MLEPRLPEPLTWDDVQTALELVDTVDELRDAVEHPEVFLHQLLEEAVGPAAVKMALARLKPVLEPRLPEPLTWDDVRPVLESMSAEELRSALDEPEALAKRLVGKATRSTFTC